MTGIYEVEAESLDAAVEQFNRSPTHVGTQVSYLIRFKSEIVKVTAHAI